MRYPMPERRTGREARAAGARRVVEMIDANEESWERMRQDTEAGGSELGNDAHKWNQYRVVLAPISVSPIP